MAAEVLNSSSVLRLNFCTKLNIYASISATSPSHRPLVVIVELHDRKEPFSKKMKIELEKYNPEWQNQFEKIKIELMENISFLHPHIEHIGSTSIKGLSAKPIIDILIGLERSDLLDEAINPLLEQDYVYYPIFNETMPYRRFFIKHKEKSNHLNIIKEEKDIPQSTEEHNLRLAHIHILTYNSEHWVRHIAFRNYLREHLSVQKEYQKLKENLSTKEWIDGNDYNKAKDSFIKTEEKTAIDWHNKTTNR